MNKTSNLGTEKFSCAAIYVTVRWAEDGSIQSRRFFMIRQYRNAEIYRWVIKRCNKMLQQFGKMWL